MANLVMEAQKIKNDIELTEIINFYRKRIKYEKQDCIQIQKELVWHD